MKLSKIFTICVLSSCGAVGANAEVNFVVSDFQPGKNDSVTTTNGTVAAGEAILFPTSTYRITDLDFTSIGGGANETIEYEIAWLSSGDSEGTLAIDNNEIGILGGEDGQIDFGNNEQVTMTLSLTENTTFDTSKISLGFTKLIFGRSEPDDLGTITLTYIWGTPEVDTTGTTRTYDFPQAMSLTYEATQDAGANAGKSIQGYDVSVTAVPEPSSYALLGGLFALISVALRRR